MMKYLGKIVYKAKVLTNLKLGNFYLLRIAGKPAENQERARKYLKAALEICTRETSPYEWAEIHFSLWRLYYCRHCRSLDPIDDMKRALESLKAALKEYKRETSPYKWAQIQSSLGCSYLSYALGGNEQENYRLAEKYYKAALEVFTKKRHPVEWADIQKKLGSLYHFHLYEDSLLETQKYSRACYEAALEIFTEESYSVVRADILLNLGMLEMNAVKYLGESGNVKNSAFAKMVIIPDPLESKKRGQAYFEEALKTYKKNKLPYCWANMQLMIGIQYSRPVHEDQNRAKTCYEAALEIFTREHDPIQWRAAKLQLGWILLEKKESKAYDYIHDGLETLLDQILNQNPEKAAIYWKDNAQYFHESIQNLLEHGHHQEALYWLETLKSRRMLIDLDFSSIRYPSGGAGQKAQDYWKVCNEIAAIRPKLEQTKSLSSTTPNISPHHENMTTFRGKYELNRLQFFEKVREKNMNRLEALISQRKSLLDALKVLAPDYASLIQPKIAQFEDLGVLIRDEETATVSSYGSGSDVHVITVYRKGGELYTKYWKWSGLDNFIETVQKFHSMASKMEWLEGKAKEDVQGFLDSLDDLTSEFGEIFRRLFGWLHDKDIKQVYLCPHHFLEAFPIHVAAFEHNGKRVVARELFDFSYLPSLSLGVKMAKDEAVNNDNIHALFYAPDNKQLQYGQEEFTGLAAIYEKRLKMRAGTEATLDLWSEDLKKNPVKTVFISCHGTTEPNGFYLRLADKELIHHSQLIGNINVKGSFVIASACETSTSLAWSKGEDEYYALDSVFILMGAVGSIGSFYSIPDISTASITTEMHRKLRQGKSHFQAFKHGVSSYLEREKEKTSIFVVKKVSGRGNTVIEPMEAIKVDSNHPICWSYLKFSGLFTQ